MSREPEDAVPSGGFWIFGFLSVVLAVLKLTVAYWSWWRVMLPLLAYLGHNALYILAGYASIGSRMTKRSRPQRTSPPESVTTLPRCYFSFCF
jgi:hypothetical protein